VETFLYIQELSRLWRLPGAAERQRYAAREKGMSWYASLIDDNTDLALRISCLAVIFVLMTTTAVQDVVAQPNNPVFRINAKTDKKDICAGCTTGGLACFGLNSCEAGCVEKQNYDCCGAFVGTGSACCPSCPGTCQPNQPCNVKENSIDLDACPAIGNAPRGCQYYTRRDSCAQGKCSYYQITGPMYCKEPPDTTIGYPPLTHNCIRECLQVSDVQLGATERTSSGCPKRSEITRYHNRCFESCGVPEWLFPDKWWWFEAEDGN
jgi:hypothetical protein